MAEQTVPNITAGHVPYDDALEANDILFDVLALINACAELNENGQTFHDPSGKTCIKDTITRLLIQATNRTHAAIDKLNV